MKRPWLLFGLLLAVVAAPAGAQGTAFTYQGRLTDRGTPPTASYDFEFKLYDSPTRGAQIGSTQSHGNVAVSNGLFTVDLDFGAGTFAGAARWLEVAVAPGDSGGPFTSLGPRRELTPTPNAIYAESAPWTGLSGKPAGFADDTDNDALGQLGCNDGDIVRRSGSSWVCAPRGVIGPLECQTSSASISNAGGGVRSVSVVLADASYRRTGGGCDCGSSNPGRLLVSNAPSGSNGWFCMCKDHGVADGGGALTAYAVGCRVP
jgi:hypothetical protein